MPTTLVFALEPEPYNIYGDRVGDLTPQLNGGKSFGTFESSPGQLMITEDDCDFSCDFEAKEITATLKSDEERTRKFYYNPEKISYSFWANFDSAQTVTGLGVSRKFKRITCPDCRNAWNRTYGSTSDGVQKTSPGRGDLIVKAHEMEHYNACKTWNIKSPGVKGLTSITGRGKTKSAAKAEFVSAIEQAMRMTDGDWATVYANYKSFANDDVHGRIGDGLFIPGTMHTCR